MASYLDDDDDDDDVVTGDRNAHCWDEDAKEGILVYQCIPTSFI